MAGDSAPEVLDAWISNLLVALSLYLQLPFGRLHSRHT